jgi:signal transduction histidine kinase
MKKGLLFLFTGCMALHLFGQNRKVDSLAALLTAARDTTRVKVLNDLTRSLWYFQLNKAAEYNAMAMALSDSLGYAPGLAEACRCRGVILSFRKDSSGMAYLVRAYDLFSKLQDRRGMAATLNNQNVYYVWKKQYAGALDVLFRSLDLFSQLQDQEAVGAVTNQIGNIFNLQSQYAAALENYLKALDIRKRIGDKPGTAFTLTRIGDMYGKLGQLPEALQYYTESYQMARSVGRNQNLIDVATSIGKVYLAQDKPDQALAYLKEALQAEETFFGKDSVFRSYLPIGEAYLAKGEYARALDYFQKALQVSEAKNQSNVGDILTRIGELYYARGDMPNALAYSLRGYRLSKWNKNHETLKSTALILSELYASRNDYKQAYQFSLEYQLAKDSLLNEDLNRRLAALKESFEIKNRQAQIDLLRRDRQLQQSEILRQKQQRIAFMLGILLFLVLVIVQARSNRQKQKTNRVLETTLANLKSAQSQLIQSEKMASLGELTAGIAHEIQNPLNFVNNFSEVNTELTGELEQAAGSGNLEEVKTLAADIRSNQEKIREHGKRADAIVKSMLLHSRTSSGEKVPVQINALADEYLRLAYQAWVSGSKVTPSGGHACNITLQTDFDELLPRVQVIPQEIGRVLLNLYNNAFYAVQEKSKTGEAGYEPRVEVSTGQVNGQLEIRVKDNGTGIPEPVKDKIFQPFFTTKPTGQGTGLGLSLSYDIIRAHGGELLVESSEAKGSTFKVRLPV